MRSRWWPRSPLRVAISPDPREKPFDDPAPRVNGEADLIGVLAYDLHRDQRGFGDLLAGIPAVGEDPLDEREDAARSPQKRSAAVAILDARRMRFEHQATPVRVDEGMALAPVDLLSSIVTAWPAGLSRLCALGVDDRTRRAGLASDPLPIELDEGVIDPLEAAFVPKLCKPSIDRAPRGQIARQQAPRAISSIWRWKTSSRRSPKPRRPRRKRKPPMRRGNGGSTAARCRPICRALTRRLRRPTRTARAVRSRCT